LALELAKKWKRDAAPKAEVMESPNEARPSAAGARSLEERARAHDREARGELLALSRTPLVAFCLRRLSDLNAAEDAAPDVLLRLSRGDHWPTGSFRAWLYCVALNHCRDPAARRVDGRIGAASLGSHVQRRRTGPGTAAARAEQHELLRPFMAAWSRASPNCSCCGTSMI
jgi:DNA-directed RNA polymerase specialized sigma24 family protein